MPFRRGAVAVVASLSLTVLVGSRAGSSRSAAGPAQASQGRPTPIAEPQKPPTAKLAEPWPDAQKLAERRVEAENRRLFLESDPLVFTLAADFKAVNRDRDTDSTKTFPAVLTVPDPAGGSASASLQVTLRTRGILRLNPRTCSFVPLSVDFPKKSAKGTVFDGQSRLKLVTHCQESHEYDQYVLREYLAYRLYNLLTPRSFRVRLSRATYVDSTSGRTLSTHNAVFIEDEEDLARRMEGRVVALPRMLFKDFDQDALTLMMLFQYMIGNTDFSIYALHNLRMVYTPVRVFYPIVWDFDVSGLVNPLYAAPDPRLGIASVRERVYRGPCRTLEEFERALAVFREKQAASLALIDALPGLDAHNKRDVAEYLGQFYTLVSRRDRLKRELVDRCRPNPTM